MQVKSIAECSKGSILQYFRPSSSYHFSLRSLFCLFLSGHFTQVLLYILSLFTGHQGTGVVSYFVFLRWLFFLNFFIFLLCFWVITFFQVAFTNSNYDEDTTGVSETESLTLAGVTLANDCSPQYQPNVTTDALSLVLDFIQGTVSNVFAVLTPHWFHQY